VVLAVGRDGIMLPIRNEEHYKEGAVATLSVYDRRGRRLGHGKRIKVHVNYCEEVDRVKEGRVGFETGKPRIVQGGL
jgi:hypothetical protein